MDGELEFKHEYAIHKKGVLLHKISIAIVGVGVYMGRRRRRCAGGRGNFDNI